MEMKQTRRGAGTSLRAVQISWSISEKSPCPVSAGEQICECLEASKCIK